jgi:hypothetical protein
MAEALLQKYLMFLDKTVMSELKILGATEQNLVARASRHPGFVDF